MRRRKSLPKKGKCSLIGLHFLHTLWRQHSSSTTVSHVDSIFGPLPHRQHDQRRPECLVEAVLERTDVVWVLDELVGPIRARTSAVRGGFSRVGDQVGVHLLDGIPAELPVAAEVTAGKVVRGIDTHGD